jgi:hypothetical protein
MLCTGAGESNGGKKDIEVNNKNKNVALMNLENRNNQAK